jgi:hypothetical protein
MIFGIQTGIENARYEAIDLGRLVRRQWGWSRVYTQERRGFQSAGGTYTKAEEDVPYVGIRINGALGWSTETTHQSQTFSATKEPSCMDSAMHLQYHVLPFRNQLSPW